MQLILLPSTNSMYAIDVFEKRGDILIFKGYMGYIEFVKIKSFDMIYSLEKF